MIWCAEEVDNGADLHGLSLTGPAGALLEPAPKLGAGAKKLRLAAVRAEAAADSGAYTTEKPAHRPTEAVLVPYHLWGNRGKGEMRVWLGESR